MNWSIFGELKTQTINGVANVVTQARWECAYTNGTLTGKANGVTDFEYNPDAPFIAYDDLSEATVVGWIKATLGEEGVSFYENLVRQKVDEAVASEEPTPRSLFVVSKYQPTQYNQVPW